MMTEIEEFARILVESVRDAAIQSNDRTLSGEHIVAQRWKEAAATGSPEAFAKVLIPDIVDSTISHLLGAIDQELLRLSFTASNGKSVDLTSVAKESGELSGWYRGEGGWCEKHSKERFIDDFADLKDFFYKPPGRDEP
ncbi:MAG TPA: hypothetical protein PKK06_14670 [Phycisphaerae bacterium]|nr:hypothetical protein [Phycisphaerae bacterium]HNU47164.1 hypothetical protein [Phycisphaerae bacterium]